jgi:hypothetical protein
MNISDLLASSGGLQAMAKELGMSESDVTSGATALSPAIFGGLKKQAQSQPTGLEGLGSLIGQLGGGGLLDDVMAPQPTNVDRGNDMLGQIFGSKDVSRAVADNAASQSGLDSGVLKKMLPILTMLISGYMAKQGGALGAGQSAAPTGGGLGDILGGLMGGSASSGGGASGGFASMLDLDGDGNPLDDILRMAGKAMR